MAIAFLTVMAPHVGFIPDHSSILEKARMSSSRW
jgi:hypothetical protein